MVGRVRMPDPEQIITAIEREAGVYQMLWNPKLCASAASGLPYNPIGHYAYRGINILSLWASQQEAAYATTAWATFKQWQAAGAQVRRGEKGTLTVFFKPMDARDRPATGEDEQSSRRFVAKAAYIFNAAQVDGYEAASPPALPTVERHAGAEALIQASGASIHHGSHQACYMPSRDQIHVRLKARSTTPRATTAWPSRARNWVSPLEPRIDHARDIDS